MTIMIVLQQIIRHGAVIMAKKQKYRVSNWSEYNKSLVNRGSLTVWFDQDSIDSWYNLTHTGKRGRPQIYSDLAIQCCLTLKAVFKLPLRATQGFVCSLMQLLSLPLSVPDYSLLSIRQRTLSLRLPKASKKTERMHLVVDSTGLKLFGEGEWKVKKHGKEKRRTWLKLHLAIDEKEHSIEACLITADNVHDCEALPELLNQIDTDVDQITGDGAYDTHGSYLVSINKGAKPCFPPRVNAIRHKATDEAHRLRNHALSQVNYHSMKYWKQKNNYHRRSLAETAMFRFKQLLGDRPRLSH
jgi:hypothetical protein